MNTSNVQLDINEMGANAAKAERLLKMLANKNRLLILCSLINGSQSVGELNANIALSQSALSQHLAKLRHLDIVTTEKKGQLVFYKIANLDVRKIVLTLHKIYCRIN